MGASFGRLARWLRDPRGAVSMVLVASLLWGSAFPAIKRGYRVLELSPDDLRSTILFAGVRFLAAGALLLGGAAVARLGLRVDRRQLGALALLGLVQTTLQYATFYVGMAHTTAVKASIIVASGSFFLAFLSPLFFRADRMTPLKVVGLSLGFSGVVVANLARGGGVEGVAWLGDGLVLATGLCSAVASLLSKRLLRSLHPVVVNGYQATLGAVVLLAAALSWGPLEARPVPAEAVGLTLYLAVVSAAAFTLYYLVVKHHDLTRVAAYRFLIPVAGVALSAALVPGESLSWHVAAAAALVAVGIWVVNAPQRCEPSSRSTSREP